MKTSFITPAVGVPPKLATQSCADADGFVPQESPWRGLQEDLVKEPNEVVPYKILPFAVESVKR